MNDPQILVGSGVSQDLRCLPVATLGPRGTDAHAVASQLFDDVRLTETFREAMELADQKRICALVPAGYVHRSDRDISETWADLHFGFMGKLRLVAVWEQETKEMCLAVNKNAVPDSSEPATLAVHPSTLALARRYAPNAELSYVHAKPLAAKMAANEGTDGCIASVDVVDDIENLSLIERFTPTMIWCLYLASDRRQNPDRSNVPRPNNPG